MKVFKKSGKPFKSGNKVNTVKGETRNEQDPKGRPAYTFLKMILSLIQINAQKHSNLVLK